MANLERLQKFVRAVTDGLQSDTRAIPDGLKTHLQALVAQDDWLPDAFAESSTESYRQYLLYCDPLERFSVVSFVWGAQQETPIHDHTVWGAIGQLRGVEVSTPYVIDESRTLQALAGQHTHPGDVITFTPERGDIHKVVNPGPDVAISIHVYGANIGAVKRSVFDPITGSSSRFVSGYSSDVIPNI